MRLGLFVAALLVVPGTARAEFHAGMACSECHARQPGERGESALRPESDVELCLRCHGGKMHVPDVLSADSDARVGTGLRSTRRRSGGGLSTAGGGRGRSEWAGHTLGSAEPPPGFIGTWPAGYRLGCKSCHAVHPYGTYRNLRPDPLIRDPSGGELADTLYPAETLPTFALVGRGERKNADVLVMRDAARWEHSSVVFRTNGGRNAMNEFCAACHGAFHGTYTEDGGRWTGKTRYVRHPTSGVPIRGRMLDKVASSRQQLRLNWREDGSPEVGCLTCHRAHGTANPFGLVHWDPRSSDNGEDGAASRMESLCRSCHDLDEPRTNVAVGPVRQGPLAQ